MNHLGGARNTIGLAAKLQEGVLPPHTHLTYQGLFNQIKYNVGPKTDKVLDLHIGYSRFQFTDSRFDNTINDYLALFLKSKTDGAERDQTTRMNLMICLDISGSMNGRLGSSIQQGTNNKSRLKLSIEAIKILVSKLKPNDSIGMVVFNSQAKVIFQSRLKQQIQSDIYETLDSIVAGGGTTIIKGLQKSRQLLINWASNNNIDKAENRIIMLTDVCDEGISSDFKSQACQVFKQVKGFNYFCAVEQEDIKKYVFQTFDFGFFPTANNIEITIDSPDIANIEVFGTPDSQNVTKYNINPLKNNHWVISRLKSSFPSQIQMNVESVLTIGGLILVKLRRHQKTSYFKGMIGLVYEDLDHQQYKQQYEINFEFHPEEQFFSGDELREAIQGYVFTSQLKSILKESQSLTAKEKLQKYWDTLQYLQSLCPKCKRKQLQNIQNILKKLGQSPSVLQPAKK